MRSREGGAVEKGVVEVRELSSDERQIRFNEILDLYEAVGWTNYTSHPEALRAGYAGSLAAWGAFAGDKLVGIVRVVGDGNDTPNPEPQYAGADTMTLRVVGDGATIVFVQDLIVAPSYQRAGIGTQLMRAVINRFADVYQMELLTDDGSGACALYERLGFVRSDAMGCVAYIRISPN